MWVAKVGNAIHILIIFPAVQNIFWEDAGLSDHKKFN